MEQLQLKPAGLSPMMERELTRAINVLKGAGARFKVILPTGHEFGDLIAVPPRGPITRTRGGRPLPKGTLLAIYGPILDSMAPGDVRQFDTPEGIAPQSPRASACTYANRKFGEGSITTEVIGRQITVLRVL